MPLHIPLCYLTLIGRKQMIESILNYNCGHFLNHLKYIFAIYFRYIYCHVLLYPSLNLCLSHSHSHNRETELTALLDTHSHIHKNDSELSTHITLSTHMEVLADLPHYTTVQYSTFVCWSFI